jgi:uncharacterized protein (TIGR00255 family)
MRSMTGFGRAEMERGGVRVAVDVRALNQRFLELKMSLPRGWGEHEGALRKLVQSFVERGRVEVTIRRVSLQPPPSRLIVNEALAGQYVEGMRRLSKRLGLGREIAPEAILQRPEIFYVVEEEQDSEAEIGLGRKALSQALKALDSERTREGAALKRDITARLAKIQRSVDKIAKLAVAARRAIIDSFQTRVRELVGTLPLDERRLYEDAAATAQRADISEELVRLTSHLAGFRELLVKPSGVGKQIDFLLQEINRETNTIGAKSQNAELSRVVVEVKGELEKIREQIQNIE